MVKNFQLSIPFVDVCWVCGSSLSPSHQTRQYCSEECKKRAWKLSRGFGIRPIFVKPVETQTCTKCNQVLPMSRFKSRGDGYKRKACKDCHGKKGNKKQWITDYLLNHPCVDCGECDPLVLDFDHRNPNDKTCEVPRCGTLSAMKIEAAKCEVRCANCHRKKHAMERSPLKCLMVPAARPDADKFLKAHPEYIDNFENALVFAKFLSDKGFSVNLPSDLIN